MLNLSDSITKCCEDLLTKALEGLMKEKGVSRKVFKQMVEFVAKLYINGENTIKYTELAKFNFSNMKYLDRFLVRLIELGYVYARYIGPVRKRLPEPVRKLRSSAKDPWTLDRCKSGAIKMRLIAYAKGEKRSMRRKCWGPYIELHFTPLMNVVRACQETKPLGSAQNG
jgi:hypothetical protein